MRATCWGATAIADARTPNLDRLASEGVRFAAHHCNSPVCTPSRQSFLTGQLPHAAGVTVLATPLAIDKPTLAKQFQKAGYRTAVFGKMHFNRPAEPGLHGFDVAMTEDEITKAWTIGRETAFASRGHSHEAGAMEAVSRSRLGSGSMPTNCRSRDTTSDARGTFIARKAIQYLEENRDRHFALWTSFQEPHSPFDFPVEDRDLFPASRFAFRAWGPRMHGRSPKFFAI